MEHVLERRGAMVGGEDRLAGVAEVAHWTEVELGPAGLFLLLLGGCQRLR